MTHRSSAGVRILKRRGDRTSRSAPERGYTARVPLRTLADVATRRLTGEPGQHFFGYYDKCPWDASGRYVLAMQAAFLDRQPRPEDVLRLGLIDLHRSQGFEAFAQTRAWCWQQGTMLQWVANRPDRTVVYNDRRDGEFVAVIRELDQGSEQVLSGPVYCLSGDGRRAIGANFARLNDLRPGYGYAGVADPWGAHDAPREDGVYLIDLESGRSDLVLPLADLASFEPEGDMAGTKHWVNHLTFSPDAARVALLHRWHPPDATSRRTRLFTMSPDGTDLRLIWAARHVSHYDWRSAHEILVWGTDPDQGPHFYVIDERSGQRRVIGVGVLTEDGHCSYRPGGRWFVNDTYPDARRFRSLMVVRESDALRVDLAHFVAPAELDGPIRCDLHPRWNRDGTQICIDSVHEGSRQMYAVDVGELIAAQDAPGRPTGAETACLQ